MLLLFIFYTTLLSWEVADGWVEIYFVDGDTLYKFNLKSGTKTKLLSGAKYAGDIFVDSRRNMLYLLVNSSLKSFKTDGTSLTDGTTLFTDNFISDSFYFYYRFVIVHDYLYYANWKHIKKVKIDTTTPTIETVKIFKRTVNHIELYTDVDETKWLYVLIELQSLVKCTLDAILCVTIKDFDSFLVEMFRFYGLHSIVLLPSDNFNSGMRIFHLNDSRIERIGHSVNGLRSFYIIGQRVFCSEDRRISVLDLKTEKSRVVLRLQSPVPSTVLYAIDMRIESGNSSMVRQSTWPNANNRTIKSTWSDGDTDNESSQYTWYDGDTDSGPTRSSLSSYGYNDIIYQQTMAGKQVTRSVLSSHGDNDIIYHQTTEGTRVKEDNTQNMNDTNTEEGDIEIYFVDGDILYKFNMKTGTKVKLLSGAKYARDILVDPKRNMLYLSVNSSMKRFKTDGTSLTDGTTLFTDKFHHDHFYFKFVIIHVYLYYSNGQHVKRVKVDTRSPTMETVKTFKASVNHMELYTDIDDIKWLYVLIDDTFLVKCTLETFRCVTIKLFDRIFVYMFKFYGLHSIILSYSGVTDGLLIFHLNDLSMERIGHNFRDLESFYLLGQQLFYRETKQISVFDFKTEKSRVIVRVKPRLSSIFVYPIDMGIESGNDYMVRQTTWPDEEADNGTTRYPVSSHGNTNSLYHEHVQPVDVNLIDSNDIILIVTGAVIFILGVSSGCIGYKKCLKKRKARNVQRMVPTSELKRSTNYTT